MRFYQYQLQFHRIVLSSGELCGRDQSAKATAAAVNSTTTQLPRKNQVRSIRKE
jgi:hypothetical protein